MKVILNPDFEIVTEIKQKLRENKKKYGKAYCPCMIAQNEDTVCMCKEFREKVKSQEVGECHCGLYQNVD